MASGVKIPPMPAVLVQVLKLERDDDAGPREYAALISRDPAMSGGVFRVVGSPVMGLRAKVDSLEKAITVLGLRTTMAVVRSEGLREALHEPGAVVLLNMLWQRMNAVADLVLAAVRTAKLRGVREDIAFQAGLFHDCGVAVLCRRFPDYAKAVHDTRGWPDLAALDEAHHGSHTMVGQMVARNWQLPSDVASAIRHHHDGEIELLPEPVRVLIVLIQFARHLVAVHLGADDSEWAPLWRDRAANLFEAAGQDLAAMEHQLSALI